MSDDNSGYNAGPSEGGGFTETTHVGWFERLKQAIGGVIAGLIAIPVAMGVLFWNEGRAVTTSRSLSEGSGLVMTLPADKVDAVNENKLIHVGGNLALPGPVLDTDFGVRTPSVRLIRKVEMYQWKEESKSEKRTNVGGSQDTVTTYEYVRAWSDKPIDSSKFKRPDGRANPPMRFQGRDFTVPQGKLGAFTVAGATLGQLGGGEALPVAADRQADLRTALKSNAVHVVDGKIYLGVEPAQPRIGDLRVSFEKVDAPQVSVIGRQAGGGFGSYQTKAGDSLLMIEKGLVPPAQMFKHAQDANTTLTWILRGVGAVAMFVGFGLIFRPLGVLADVLPILGDVVRMGTGFIAFLLTAVFSTLTIAIAWFYYRPLVAIIMLVIGGGITAGLIMLGRKRKAARMGGMVPAGAGPIRR